MNGIFLLISRSAWVFRMRKKQNEVPIGPKLKYSYQKGKISLGQP